MDARVPLSAQASACDTAVRVFVVGLKPSQGEKRLLAERLKAARDSLYFIEQHDMEFRDFIRRKREGQQP